MLRDNGAGGRRCPHWAREGIAVSSGIGGSGIDKVLQEAVASGAVPHVVAIAATGMG